MTVMEMLRGLRPGEREAPGEGEPDHAWAPLPLRAALAGLVGGLVSILLVLVPTLLAWMVVPTAAASFGSAVGVGSALWLVLHGAHVFVGGADIALVPLLLGLLMVVLAAVSARHVVRVTGTDDDYWRDLLPRSLGVSLLAWWGGYALVVLGGVGLAFLGPARATWSSVPLALLVVPLLAVALVLRREYRLDREVVGVRLDPASLPVVVQRALAPSRRGLRTLLGAGLLVVLVSLTVHLGEVRALTDSAGADAFGGFLLGLVQVAAAPNLALWASAVLVGPGYHVVEGADVTLSGVQGGLMPLVPVFGAQPQPGAFPAWAWGLLLVPVVVGGVVGTASLESLARLSTLRAKVGVALTACVLTALGFGLLQWLASGSLGAYRLSDVGASPLWTALALLPELLLGAGAVIAWDAWRLRR